MKIRKDGKAYDGCDVVVTALGNQLDGVSAIEYGSSQEHQHNYSLGSRRPTSFSMGKISHTGSITMYMHQIVALEKAAGGSLLNIKPFDINVTFIDEYNAIVNDTVVAKFASEGREVNTEMGLAKQLELFVLDINPNNA